MLSLETPSITSEFPVDPPFPDFSQWFRDVVDEVRPDLVVAIARGAVRLLQLQRSAQAELGDCPVVSQHALAFFEPETLRGKRVLIFDDSVVYGSTMREVFTRLSRLGAVVTCAAFALDREVFLGNAAGSASPHSTLPIIARHRLPSSLIRRHHDRLVQALITYKRDYNIDFPAVTVYLTPGLSFAEIGAALERTGLFEDFVEVSTVVGAAASVHRGSIFFARTLSPLADTSAQRWRSFSKARLTWCKAAGELRITPLAQLALDETLAADKIQFVSADLAAWWQQLKQPLFDGQYSQDAAFRLLNAFVSMALGAFWSKVLSDDADLNLVGDPELDVEDVSVILTSPNASVLRQAFDALRALPKESLVTAVDEHWPVETPGKSDEYLLELIEASWQESPYLMPVSGDLPYEAVAKVLLSLNSITDTAKTRSVDSSSARLNVGLSHESITRFLTERCGLSMTLRDVALAIDIAIDCGQAAPKVLACDGWRMRRLYCGENRRAVDPIQFKAALHRHYGRYLDQKGARKLTPYEFTKLCVVLRDVIERLPISTHYRTFGRTATIGSEEIIDVLVKGSGSPFLLGTYRGRDVLEINKAFKPWVSNTWDPNLNRAFADGFNVLANVFNRVSDDAVLLLSTCRTHRHTYAAVAVEAHNWTGSIGQIGFERFLNALHSALDTGLPMTADAAVTLVFLTSYVNEAARKHRVFSQDFQTRTSELLAEFQREGIAGTNFWDYEIAAAGKLDPSRDEEILSKFESLLPLLEQMKWLTAFASAMGRQWRLLEPSLVKETFHSKSNPSVYKTSGWSYGMVPHVAASHYNSFLTRGGLLGRSVVKTELVSPSDGADPKEVLASIDSAFLELRDAVQIFVPQSPVDEGNENPFAPDLTIRVLADGTKETELLNQFILAMDIVRSNDSVTAAHLKDSLIATLDKFSSKNVYYSTSGDDSFICSCSDPNVLWDLLHVIRTTEEAFVKDANGCQGTRKGVFSGPITLKRWPDGRSIIKDVVEPHRLSRSVNVMEAVINSALASRTPARKLVALEADTAARLSTLLGLAFDAAEEVLIDAKHFRSGKAMIVPCP